MKSFIDQVLDHLEKKTVTLHHATYIVPSRRVAIFLKKAIAKRISQPVIAPNIYSVADFIEQLAQVNILPDADLLLDFYTAYCTVEPAETRDHLDEFLNWAPTLLKDFNEIDRFLVPTDSFFNYLGNLKAIENDHWSLENNSTPMVQNYLSFWDKLQGYYTAFKKHCIATGHVYQGLAYRLAFAKATSQQHLYNPTNPLVFMGLNALNKAEESILKHFLEKDQAHIYWDADALYMDDYIHEAGKFLRTYKKEWKYYQHKPFSIINKQLQKPKKINVLGATGQLGMAQVAGEQLEKFLQESPDLTNTAIILADEQLLQPILQAIPPEIQHFNITMGLNVAHTPMAAFFNDLIKLQVEQTDKGFYFKSLFNLLESPFCTQIVIKDSIELQHKIKKNNLVYIPKNQYQKYPKDHFLHLILQSHDTVIDLHEYLKEIVHVLKNLLYNNSLQIEQLHAINKSLNQLDTLLSHENTITRLKTYHHIFKQIIAQHSMDLIGEPVQGLQIMGLLETRAIDYDRIIMIGVNEGILPAGKSNASIIPYDMKMKFGLPTYSDKDSVYAYHFYRLLHRSQNAVFIYNTKPSKIGSNERSRFIMQLENQRSLASYITHNSYTFPITKSDITAHSITKNKAYFTRLDQIKQNGFSPSTLTSYIYNPLDFYKKKILKIQDLEEVEEDIASNTMGTIIHKSLEQLYENTINQILTIEHLQLMLKKVPATVKKAYLETYGDFSSIHGKNKIIFEVAIHYVKKMILMDQKAIEQNNEIIIRELEADYHTTIEIAPIGTVRLHGQVDRIDTFNNSLRIIDYKTGNVSKSQLHISPDKEHLLIEDYKYSKAFQVLQYAFMYSKQHQVDDIQAGIISFKNLKDGFMPYTYNKNTNISEKDLDLFQQQLSILLQELYDPEIPITEKETQ